MVVGGIGIGIGICFGFSSQEFLVPRAPRQIIDVPSMPVLSPDSLPGLGHRRVAIGRGRHLTLQKFRVQAQFRELQLDDVARHAVKKEIVRCQSIEKAVYAVGLAQEALVRVRVRVRLVRVHLVRVRGGDHGVKVFHVKTVLGVRVEENPVKLDVSFPPKFWQHVLPPAKTHSDVRPGVPTVLAELGVDIRVRLDDGVLGWFPFLLQNGIDDAHAKSDVEYPPGPVDAFLGRADVLQQDPGVGPHDGALPLHHDGVPVRVEQCRLVAVVGQ
mmetsp:Transcript_15308/g.42472  ORF Transcript_15308/g.42472 Transcript_15308/m.42472 type:complete len:271 (-) Transcript_15308:685-1497(-)